jgi:hypothetical protein
MVRCVLLEITRIVAPIGSGGDMATRPATSASKGTGKVHKVMEEYKEGTLKSGSGDKVKSRKQAVAIALNEARKSGANIPKKTK